jgi:hypothetical protein
MAEEARKKQEEEVARIQGLEAELERHSHALPHMPHQDQRKGVQRPPPAPFLE